MRLSHLPFSRNSVWCTVKDMDSESGFAYCLKWDLLCQWHWGISPHWVCVKFKRLFSFFFIRPHSAVHVGIRLVLAFIFILKTLLPSPTMCWDQNRYCWPQQIWVILPLWNSSTISRTLVISAIILYFNHNDDDDDDKFYSRSWALPWASSFGYLAPSLFLLCASWLTLNTGFFFF